MADDEGAQDKPSAEAGDAGGADGKSERSSARPGDDGAKAGPPPNSKSGADGASGEDAAKTEQDGAKEKPDPAKLLDRDTTLRAIVFAALQEACAAYGQPITIGSIVMGDATVDTVVGGDMRGEDPRSRPSDVMHGPTRIITTEHLERIDATFVCPECFGPAEATLQSTGLLLLRAKPGWGRETIALKLLHQHCKGELCKLDAETFLPRSGLPEVEQQHGYIVDALEPRHVRWLRVAYLETLSQHLQKHGALMVMVLDYPAPLRGGDFQNYLVDGGAPAPTPAVIGNHLRWQLRPLLGNMDDVDRRASELLDDEQVGAVIAELSSSSASDLVAFATDLAGAYRSAETVGKIVHRHSRSVASRFVEWFDGQTDIEQRALVIALAAFHEMPLHIVGRTASLLADRIREAENPDPELVRRTLFVSPMRERIAAAGAEIVDGTETTLYGQIAVELVRFRHGALGPVVLEHVWDQHEHAHAVVRDWLRDLGIDHDPAVRARAGAAVGHLSRREFGHMQEHVVKPWADYGDFDRQQAAVAALHVLSSKPAHRGLVRRLILDWLRPYQPTSRRATAIATLASVSVLPLQRTLSELRRAVRDELELIGPAADALTQLFVLPESQGPVLAALLSWSSAMKANLRHTAHLAALWIAEESHVKAAFDASTWPAMVELAEHSEHRADIVRLFGILCNAPLTSERTYRLIRRWVLQAGRDPEFLPPLRNFLAAVVAETNDAVSLRWYLDRWRKDARVPKTVLDELIAEMRSGAYT
jgi:hypothetical protein